MKKVLSLLLLAGVFSLASCDAKKADESPVSETAVEATTATDAAETTASSLDSAAAVADTTSSTSDTTAQNSTTGK